MGRELANRIELLKEWDFFRTQAPWDRQWPCDLPADVFLTGDKDRHHDAIKSLFFAGLAYLKQHPRCYVRIGGVGWIPDHCKLWPENGVTRHLWQAMSDADPHAIGGEMFPAIWALRQLGGALLTEGAGAWDRWCDFYRALNGAISV